MTHIDWTKPIETVPCDRNPVPVPCEFQGFNNDGDGDAMVFIRGDWFAPRDGGNKRDRADATEGWYFHPETGSADVSFLPLIRNTAESD